MKPFKSLKKRVNKRTVAGFALLVVVISYSTHNRDQQADHCPDQAVAASQPCPQR